MREGNVERARFREQRRRGPGARAPSCVCVNGARNAAAAAVRDRALELGRGRRGVEQREVRDRHQAAAGRTTEVGDPAVVRAHVGDRDLRVGDLALPQQSDRRIEDALLQVLASEQLDTLGRVAGAERHVVHVAAIGSGPRVRIAHRAHQAEDAVLGSLRRPPVELEILEPALVDAHPHGARTEAFLEVLFPEPRRLEDVSVRVDRPVVGEPQHLVSHAQCLQPRSWGGSEARVKPAGATGSSSDPDGSGTPESTCGRDSGGVGYPTETTMYPSPEPLVSARTSCTP